MADQNPFWSENFLYILKGTAISKLKNILFSKKNSKPISGQHWSNVKLNGTPVFLKLLANNLTDYICMLWMLTIKNWCCAFACILYEPMYYVCVWILQSLTFLELFLFRLRRLRLFYVFPGYMLCKAIISILIVSWHHPHQFWRAASKLII